AISFGQRLPSFAKLSSREYQHFVAGRGEIADCGLHGPGAGGGEHDDIIAGTYKSPEISQHFTVKGAEFGSAMMHGRSCHSELRRRKECGRAGSEKASLLDHSW